MAQGKNNGKPERNGIRFVTEYVHWRTKKMMRASDYGYKAWPFGKKRKG
jgi:hypothetical protein